MKNFLRRILRFCAKLIAFIIHPFVIRIIKSSVNYITTEYIIKQLKVCGVNPLLCFPIKSVGLKYIQIGDDFFANSRLTIEVYDFHLNQRYNPKVVIGNNVRMGEDCHIGCVNYISIGNNVLIASKVFITDHFHGNISSEDMTIPPNSRRVISKGAIVIEDNVWIGENVAIMPNVKIGKNSIIGANAVITKNIPANCVAGGVPATVLKSFA